jgi:hypothetical protein
MTKRKIAEYKYTDKEIRELVKKEFHIEKEIRKDKKEKRDYIKEEIREIQMIPKHKYTAIDDARLILLLNQI